MTQALEQMLELVPTIGQDRMYGTIDQYATGTTALYSFDPPKPMAPMPGTQIKPLGNDFAILPYGNQTGLGGDVHDSFNYDPLGNLRNGHTTVRLPGDLNKKINWP